MAETPDAAFKRRVLPKCNGHTLAAGEPINLAFFAPRGREKPMIDVGQA
jgi:hypothetical protein